VGGCGRTTTPGRGASGGALVLVSLTDESGGRAGATGGLEIAFSSAGCVTARNGGGGGLEVGLG
jgi:hypothetical protein